MKANQPTLHREIAAYFADPAVRAQTVEEVDKGHGRLEIRRYAVSHETDWLSGNRRYAGEPRFPGLRSIARVEAQVERNGETTCATRLLSLIRAAHAGAPGSGRSRPLGHREQPALGARRCVQGGPVPACAPVTAPETWLSSAIFAINAVRLAKGKRSIKTTRKLAGWDTRVLSSILTPSPR